MPQDYKRKPSASSRAKAAAHLKNLDREYEEEKMKRKKNALRTEARMGDRKTRNEAARKLNSMPRKPRQQN